MDLSSIEFMKEFMIISGKHYMSMEKNMQFRIKIISRAYFIKIFAENNIEIPKTWSQFKEVAEMN